jgi:hypothetical protein
MRCARSGGRLRPWFVVLVVLLATAGTSCGTDKVVGPPTDVAFLEVVGDTLLPIGRATSFGVLAFAVDGTTAVTPPVLWSTLESYVATVSTAGQVTGRAPGLTSIVARSGNVADSLRIRVQGEDLPTGAVRGWIRTADARTPIAWTGEVDVLDVMGGESGDRSRLTLTNGGEPGIADSLLRIDWGGGPLRGRTDIDAHPASGGTGNGVVAVLAIVTDELHRKVYYSVAGGSLAWSRVSYPPRAGLIPGSGAGLVELRLAQYDPGGSAGSTATADTVQIYVEFDVWLQHLLRPRVAASLDGGPATGSTSSTFGQSWLGSNRLEVWWDIDLDEVPGQGWSFEAQQAFVLDGPSPGSFPIGEIGMAEYADPSAWPGRFAVVHYRDDLRVALSRGGVVTLTVFRPPSAEYYGELEGTFAADLELWNTDGEPTGGTVKSTATFGIPINPIGAAPSGPLGTSGANRTSLPKH